MDLHGCDIMDNSHMTGKSTFLICNSMGMRYEMQANSSKEQQVRGLLCACDTEKEWLTAIKKAISEPNPEPKNNEEEARLQGWLTKRGKKRYFIILKDVLMWFDHNPADQRNAFTMRNVVKHVKDVRFSLNIKELKETKDMKAVFTKVGNEPLGSITLAGLHVTSHTNG